MPKRDDLRKKLDKLHVAVVLQSQSNRLKTSDHPGDVFGKIPKAGLDALAIDLLRLLPMATRDKPQTVPK
jgi:hypothetical protein